MGGIHDPNNPERVPPVLAAIDQPQEGLPRIIHPLVGIPVGRPDPGAASMEAANEVVIKKDGVYEDADGNRFNFRKGARLSAARAARFPDLSGENEGRYIDGTTEARAVPEAPENRMEAAPENRGRMAGAEEPKRSRRKADKPAEPVTGLARGNEDADTAPGEGE